MPQKIRLTVSPCSGHQKDVDLPDDWEDMDKVEQEDYLAEEARDFMESVTKFHGEVVDLP